MPCLHMYAKLSGFIFKQTKNRYNWLIVEDTKIFGKGAEICQNKKKDGFFSSYEKIWKIRKVSAKVNNDNALGFNKSLTILTRTRQQRKNYTKRGIFILKILRMKEIIIPDYNHKLKFTQL